MAMSCWTRTAVVATLAIGLAGQMVRAADPDYTRDVAPLLRKHCVSCHDAEDAEGKLSLHSYDALMRGGRRGAAVMPGNAELSRLARMLTGQAKPQMPPEDNEPPSAAEIKILVAWINSGAKGPRGEVPDPTRLVVPRIAPRGTPRAAIAALAVARSGQVAVARYGQVELEVEGRAMALQHQGNVNSVRFANDGKLLVTAAGEAGLFGEARIWEVATGKLIRRVQGHSDSLYCAALSPDGHLLATAGYDRRIMIWEAATGKRLRTMAGHNGAVYDLAFHPRGHLLASASGDRTVKLWRVADGTRLDTFNQSLKELYTLAFSPDGRRVAAAGVDNRVRIWEVSDSGAEGTNRLLYSVFAHERPIVRIAYAPDGKTLVSSAEDRLVKTWNAADLSPRRKLPPQPDWATALAIRNSGELLVGRLDGSRAAYQLDPSADVATAAVAPLSESPPEVDYGAQPELAKLPRVGENEPNDTPAKAARLTVPAVGTGVISQAGDRDLFGFDARQGDQWIIEVRAARDKSPLDSRIEVLNDRGEPVQRLLLRAVRDSEVEFRGVNSDQRGARLKNWEEMVLNEFIYLNGEVIKHFLQRRGPDSDAQFYPEGGSRRGYFDTTVRAHPLGQPCYVVVPYPVGTRLPDNGLPVFPLNFENDDDGLRELGKDSRLTFVAPADGRYVVRVSDVREFGGEKFKYQLIVRRPQPDFQVTISGGNPTIGAGSGREFTVRAKRRDNFNGPIEVRVDGLPPGFSVTSPIVIQAGHREARGVINAAPDAPQPTKENAVGMKIVATGTVAGRQVEHAAGTLGTIKLAGRPKLVAYLEPDPANVAEPGVETETGAMGAGETAAEEGDAEEGDAEEGDAEARADAIPEVVITAGEMTTCRLRVDRHGFKGRIQFDVNNLPHGVIVDDIGLSGVLIPEGQTERVIFLSAESWVPPTSRLFHAVAKVEGNQVSRPMRLIVRPARSRQP